MANIRTLSVSVKANTSKFQAGMKRAGNVLKRFGARVNAVTGKLKFMAAAAGAGAVAGLTLLTRQSLQTVDRISKLSDELQIGTDKLRGLTLAARLTGTSTETLTKGLQRLVRTLGEAKAGYGEGVKGLKALGFETAELGRIQPLEALLRVADAVKKQKGAADQAAAAYALFGRQGQELLNFLQLGSRGLQDIQRDAEHLGGTFLRAAGRPIEAFLDSMTRVGFAAEGVGIKLARSVSIGLTPFTDGLAESIAAMNDMGQMSDKAIAGTAFTAFEKLAKAMAFVVKFGLQIKKVFLQVGEGILAIAQAAIGSLAKLQGASASVAEFFSKGTFLPKGLRKGAAESAARLRQSQGELQAQAGGLAVERSGLGARADRVDVDIRAITFQIDRFFENVAKATAERAKKQLGGGVVSRLLGQGVGGLRGLIGGISGGLGGAASSLARGGSAFAALSSSKSVGAATSNPSLTQITRGFGSVSGGMDSVKENQRKTAENTTELVELFKRFVDEVVNPI